ncbi:hypothetical protein QJS10_CPB11g02209 [Acorus calamus]|uniref:Zinc finger PHD-type domain-containing protein n=1 Tax=Acorus calamus TaxID=4465 RepID=A0AAV9DRY2_ACOCL|nr:hypothetical protein QJS10_CPB11g02209 [Acorus calamus]
MKIKDKKQKLRTVSRLEEPCPHPELTNQSHPKTPDNNDAPLCAICNHNVSGLTYTCTTCNFHLHYSCARIPQRIRHLADPDHILTLHANPVYPNGKFQCNACGGHGGVSVSTAKTVN